MKIQIMAIHCKSFKSCNQYKVLKHASYQSAKISKRQLYYQLYSSIIAGHIKYYKSLYFYKKFVTYLSFSDRRSLKRLSFKRLFYFA